MEIEVPQMVPLDKIEGLAPVPVGYSAKVDVVANPTTFPGVSRRLFPTQGRAVRRELVWLADHRDSHLASCRGRSKLRSAVGRRDACRKPFSIQELNGSGMARGRGIPGPGPEFPNPERLTGL